MIKVLACSERVIEKVMGPPQRGLVHSVFSSAANLLFPPDFLLSLNYFPFPTPGNSIQSGQKSSGKIGAALLPALDGKEGLFLMPNGMLLGAQGGERPFAGLRAGTPVLLGAGWLVLEALSCSLDCSHCRRWNPRIERPPVLDAGLLRANARWLARFCQTRRPAAIGATPKFENGETILELAARICGRGPGLTPSGDDFLAGWLASGWLLYGPQPSFLANCQRITEIASQRTNILSQCWLAYAARGDVAYPIHALLASLLSANHEQLELAASNVLALGATSGYDLLQGILAGIEQFPLF